ncbi:amino acid adenylation [Scleroderma citrinum]
MIHHIIIDEASLGVFFYDFFHIYLNGPGSLPKVPIHYSNFSNWLLKTSECHAELHGDHPKFWAQNLQVIQSLHLTLATPFDWELAPITQIEAKIGIGALEYYMKVINTATATPFAGFFAAYNILLHKNLPMLTNVIGFFTNMLPVKTKIDETKTFSEYLIEFKNTLIACLTHDEVTYEDIIAQGKSSSTGHGYSNTYSCQVTKSNISLPNGKEQYEFLLTIHPRTGHVILWFDNHLYTEDAAHQFLDTYISLIETLGSNPNVTIKDISIVSKLEHECLVKELSSSSDITMQETCLHKLVEGQAKKTPHFTTVKFEDQSLTYAELNATVNRIARLLIQEGVHQGNVIALCFNHGISQILDILAVLKAGATFVPLDPDDLTLCKELMVEECSARVLLTTSNHSCIFQKSLAAKVLITYIDDTNYQKCLARLSADNFEVEGLSPSSLAYIMFTSGSIYGFQQGVHVMSSLAYTFDPFVVDVFGSLAHGATLVTGQKELVFGDIPKAIHSLCISVLHVTPSILTVVPIDDYPTLETVVVAGEALRKKLIQDWSSHVTLHNMYGPMEASVDCTLCHVTGPALTGQLKLTPIGVEGELYIGGIQLACGYLNQPELTMAAFLLSPFIPSECIYKTGDIALYYPDSNIKYCGCTDCQIKLHGQHIKLSEIKDMITKYSAVKCAAVVIHTVQDVPAIVAFVKFNNMAEELEEEKEALKVFIAEHLPRFMYLSLITILSHLLALCSSKIDCNTLKLMDLKAF